MAMKPFHLRPLHFGLAASLMVASLVFGVPQSFLEGQRELFFDALTQMAPQPVSNEVLAVDIDRHAYQTAPNGDWNRAETAQLVARLAAAKPAAIAFDLVFSGDCEAGNAANQALADAMRCGRRRSFSAS